MTLPEPDNRGLAQMPFTGWVLNERASVLIPDLTRFEEQKTQLDKIYPGKVLRQPRPLLSQDHPRTPQPP